MVDEASRASPAGCQGNCGVARAGQGLALTGPTSAGPPPLMKYGQSKPPASCESCEPTLMSPATASKARVSAGVVDPTAAVPRTISLPELSVGMMKSPIESG